MADAGVVQIMASKEIVSDKGSILTSLTVSNNGSTISNTDKHKDIRGSIQKPRQRGKKAPNKKKLAKMTDDQRRAFAARQRDKITATERHSEAKNQRVTLLNL